MGHAGGSINYNRYHWSVIIRIIIAAVAVAVLASAQGNDKSIADEELLFNVSNQRGKFHTNS